MKISELLPRLCLRPCKSNRSELLSVSWAGRSQASLLCLLCSASQKRGPRRHSGWTLLLLSVDVSGNLDPRLYSGEYRKRLWFSFSPVTSDNGPFVTLVSVYFMGTDTWDEIGRYESHKAFLHTWMERGRGVQRPHNGRTWLKQAAWRNKEQWLESARVASVSSFLTGTSHWPSTTDPIQYKSKMLSPPCLPRVITGSKWQDDVKMLRK